MPVKKITQEQETKALQKAFRDLSDNCNREQQYTSSYHQSGMQYTFSSRYQFNEMQCTSLSQFFDEAPISIEDKATVIGNVFSLLILDDEFDLIFGDGFDDDQFEFASFNDVKEHALNSIPKCFSLTYEGVSLKAQQVKTILSDIGGLEKASILMCSTLLGILDKNESVQEFKKLISDTPILEEKYELVGQSLCFNFDLKDEYESLMSNYQKDFATEYVGLLLESAILPTTKDWVKKEYFTNVLEDTEFFNILENTSTNCVGDVAQSFMRIIQEAQQELFGE